MPDSAYEEFQTRTISGIKVSFLPRFKQNPIARVMVSHAAQAIGAFADRGDYDLVHVQAAPEWSTHIRQPLVTTIHGINEQDMLFRGSSKTRKMIWPLIRFSEQRKRRKIDNLIVINPYVRTAIGNALQGRSWDIENPVRVDFFELTRRPEPYTILFAGVVTSRKNVSRLIQAMARVKESIPQAKLHIAGELRDSVYVASCQDEVERFGLQDNVEFLGNLSVAQMQEHLSRTHVLALTSLQETAPLCIEEAMAAGVPVVSSNICGMPYMVQDGVTGALVDPKDVDDIALGIVRIMRMDLPAVAKASTEIARKRFNGKRVARQTVEVYREVLDSVVGTPKRHAIPF